MDKLQKFNKKIKKLPPILYTLNIVRDAKFWQSHSLLHELEPEIKKSYFRFFQIFFCLISFIIVYFANNGISKEFAGFIITALSIFIGLNINLIIMMYDKFQNIDFNTKNKTYKDKIRLLKKRNFYKQFTSLTAYSISIAILLLILLSICFTELSTTSLQQKIRYGIYFIQSDSHLLWSSKVFILAIKDAAIIIIRFITYYFLFDYLLIILYSIGSIYTYIYSEYSNIKIRIYDKPTSIENIDSETDETED